MAVINGLPNIFIANEKLDYEDKQRAIFQYLFKICNMWHELGLDPEAVYYDPRDNPDRIALGDFCKQPPLRTYCYYNDIRFEELDEQVLDIYRNYKRDVAQEPWKDPVLRPFVMIVDGVEYIKNPDDFITWIEDCLTLIEFCNIYILCIM